VKNAHKCFFGRGLVLNPACGAYSAPPDHPVGLREGKGEEQKGKKEGAGEGSGMAGERWGTSLSH